MCNILGNTCIVVMSCDNVCHGPYINIDAVQSCSNHEGPHDHPSIQWNSPGEGTPRWGALGQVSYGGVQLRGPNPYPILGKAGLRKHTLS